MPSGPWILTRLCSLCLGRSGPSGGAAGVGRAVVEHVTVVTEALHAPLELERYGRPNTPQSTTPQPTAPQPTTPQPTTPQPTTAQPTDGLGAATKSVKRGYSRANTYSNCRRSVASDSLPPNLIGTVSGGRPPVNSPSPAPPSNTAPRGTPRTRGGPWPPRSPPGPSACARPPAPPAAGCP